MGMQEGEEVTTEQLQRSVLWDETLTLSALFRYCLARREGLKDVAHHYRLGAAMQYMRHHEDYDAVWGDWISDKFKDYAQRTYQSVLAGALQEEKGNSHGQRRQA